MKKVVEGNPELVEEHPYVLEKGAHIYWFWGTYPMIEIPLEGLLGEKSPNASQWEKITGMLEEVRKVGKYPTSLPSPHQLVNTVRHFFQDNGLYEEIRKREDVAVRLCLSEGRPHSIKRVEDKYGICSYIPKPLWAIEVIPNTTMADPKDK